MRMLTHRRRQILRAVEALTRAKGYPPLVREIGDAVGLASKASVHRHLHLLCNGRWLSQQPNRDGTLRLGPRTAISRDGVIAEAVKVDPCEVCGCDMPADHVCAPVDHPGTDALLADLKTTREEAP